MWEDCNAYSPLCSFFVLTHILTNLSGVFCFMLSVILTLTDVRWKLWNNIFREVLGEVQSDEGQL